MPATEVVEVDGWLVEHTSELRFELVGGNRPCGAGLQFGSRLVVPPMQGLIYDYLPEEPAGAGAEPGELCRDPGAGQMDVQRQRAAGGLLEEGAGAEVHGQLYRPGILLQRGGVELSGSPLRGVYARNDVYRGVTGWESFEPWLGNIERMDEAAMWRCAEEIPPEWYGESSEMERLVETWRGGASGWPS